ncbi:MAG: hypothetical protein M1823_004252 [Watsoniomyces obsoletus]|nr:MAG: hypothetical protein M1823_004252 [Watsoniomyces obsoletus]
MAGSILFPILCLGVLPLVQADGWSDFTNNLATDLAPLLTLFGEQVTRQWLSESTTMLDCLIFSLGPLGILTAVVSAIRVRGSPSFRAFIGRAQEGPGNAEIELLSCTSLTTSELWNDGGISRVFGKPQLLEVVTWEPKDEDFEFPEEPGSDGPTAGISSMKEAPRHGVWEQTRQSQGGRQPFKRSSNGGRSNNRDSEAASVGGPNLSLNVGIRRRPTYFFYVTAALGLALQTGVIVFACLASSPFRPSFKRDGKLAPGYGLSLAVSGTVMVSVGMFLCAHLIEASTDEVYYDRIKDSRIYWLQPGGQKVGDQVFHAFLGKSDDRSFVTSHRLRKRSSEGYLLWAAVGLTILGFVSQFVGLRATHPSVTLAQLGVSLLMAFLRACLRSRRTSQKDNLLAEISQQVSGHELDYLAMELEGAKRRRVEKWKDPVRQGRIVLVKDGAFLHRWQSEFKPSSPTRSDSSCSHNYSGLETICWSVLESSQAGCHLVAIQMGLREATRYDYRRKYREPAMTAISTARGSHLLTPSLTRLISTRARLARLTNDQCGTAWEDFPSRPAARCLVDCIERTTELLSNRLEGSVRSYYWPVFKLLGVHESKTVSETFLRLSKASSGSQWRADESEIEALLALMTWSVKEDEESRPASSSEHRRVVAAGRTAAELEKASHAFRDWLPVSRLNCVQDTFVQNRAGAPVQRRPNAGTQDISFQRYFGWELTFESRAMKETRSSEEEEDGRTLSFKEDAISETLSSVENTTSATQSNEMQMVLSIIPAQAPLERLCAQDIFVSFFSALIRSIDDIGGETTFSDADSYRLVNTEPSHDFNIGSSRTASALKNSCIEELVNVFKESGLGSSAEAYSCIIPVLATQSKLPTKHLNTASAEQYYQHSSQAMRSADDSIWEIGCWGVRRMLWGDGVPSAIKDIERQFGWIADHIAQEHPKHRHDPIIAYTQGGSANLVSIGYTPDQPVEYWVLRGDAAVIRYLIGEGTVEPSDLQGLLHVAVENGRDEVVRLMSQKGVDVNQPNTEGVTPLLHALSNQHPTTASVLIERGANYEGRGKHAWAELEWATRNGYRGLEELLLVNRAELEARTQKAPGDSIIEWAVLDGRLSIVRSLLERGHDIDGPKPFGRTLLSLAVNYGQEAIAQLLLEKGAGVEEVNDDGETALHLAVRHGKKSIVQLLLEKEANLKAADKKGRTALHLAAGYGRDAIVPLLLAKGANVEDVDNDGQTALHLAVEWDIKAIVQLLLEAGANVNAIGKFKKTALHMAALDGQTAVMTVLLEGRADIHATDNQGCTALHIAVSTPVSTPYKDVVLILANWGADPQMKNHEGVTALDIARIRGRDDLVNLLSHPVPPI